MVECAISAWLHILTEKAESFFHMFCLKLSITSCDEPPCPILDCLCAYVLKNGCAFYHTKSFLAGKIPSVYLTNVAWN